MNLISFIFTISINYKRVLMGKENGKGKVPPKKYSLLNTLQSISKPIQLIYNKISCDFYIKNFLLFKGSKIK